MKVEGSTNKGAEKVSPPPKYKSAPQTRPKNLPRKLPHPGFSPAKAEPAKQLPTGPVPDRSPIKSTIGIESRN